MEDGATYVEPYEEGGGVIIPVFADGVFVY